MWSNGKVVSLIAGSGVLVVNMETGCVLLSIADVSASSTAFMSNGNILVLTTDGYIRIYDYSSGAEIKNEYLGDFVNYKLFWSESLFTIYLSNSLQFYDSVSLNNTSSMALTGSLQAICSFWPKARIALSTSDSDLRVKVTELDGQTLAFMIENKRALVLEKYSNDSLVIGTDNATVEIWNVYPSSTLQVRACFGANAKFLRTLSDKRVAIGFDQTVTIWNPSTNSVDYKWQAVSCSSYLSSLLVTEDGDVMTTENGSNEISVWTLSGAKVASYLTPTSFSSLKEKFGPSVL
jgi:WD40 repeat protein